MKSKKHKFHIPLKKRAESLIETVVAITVIAIGATATAILVRTSMLGNELSQDRMFAISLAEEGIEAVRSIRDTNWLRFSSNKDGCWNAMPGAGLTISTCHSNLIEEDSYVLKLYLTDEVLSYYLIGGVGNVFDSINQLYECPINNVTGDTGVLYTIPNDPVTFSCTTIDFYRRLAISYDPVEPDLMIVTSEVGWYTDGNEKTISITESIANW